MKNTFCFVAGLAVTSVAAGPVLSARESSRQEKKGNDIRLNVMILTLDDMGRLSLGAEGNGMDVSPNLDRLASEGMLLSYCYNLTPMSGPSRNALLSGRYPHCNGAMGHGTQPPAFWQQPEVEVPTISTYLHDNGYFTAAILKNSREMRQTWDRRYREIPFGVGEFDRNPDVSYQRMKESIQAAQDAGKPFFIYASSIDPHNPWPGTEQERKMLEKWNPLRKFPEPDRKYSPEEVYVPAFIPDLPGFRKNLCPYYESVHRGDAVIGAMLKALEESGEMDHTIIFFLSDHGMYAPGAKSNLSPWGVRTPLIVRCPGLVEPGSKNDVAIVESIDIYPTVLEILGLPSLDAMEGKSMYDVITGKEEESVRDYAYSAHTWTADSVEKFYFPQRSINDRRFCYIWNPYVTKSDKPFTSVFLDFVPKEYQTSDYPDIQRKINTVMYKPLEEFYDLEKDPGCWNNVIDDPAYQKKIQEYRDILREEMITTRDPEYYKYQEYLK